MWKQRWLGGILLGVLSLGSVACERDGAMEEAGERVDEGVNEASDAVKDATN